MRMPRSFACTLAALAATIAALPAMAQDAAQFYTGRSITFLVGYGSGASYDTGARMVARHLGKYIPGKPSIVVQNLPGAGSMVAANQLYYTAAKDGSVIAMFGRGLYLEALFGRSVDLVTEQGLKPRARKQVERDLVRVA